MCLLLCLFTDRAFMSSPHIRVAPLGPGSAETFFDISPVSTYNVMSFHHMSYQYVLCRLCKSGQTLLDLSADLCGSPPSPI